MLCVPNLTKDEVLWKKGSAKLGASLQTRIGEHTEENRKALIHPGTTIQPEVPLPKETASLGRERMAKGRERAWKNEHGGVRAAKMWLSSDSLGNEQLKNICSRSLLCHLVFICCSVLGYLGWFRNLAVLNRAAINIGEE